MSASRVTRTYVGADQRDAVRRYAADAQAMARRGYRVATHTWDAGRRDVSRGLSPGVLGAWHGTLTVTYESRARQSRPPDLVAAMSLASPGVAAELIDLLTARAYGIISDDQFRAMRRRLVPRR